jgi:hypothetical protein
MSAILGDVEWKDDVFGAGRACIEYPSRNQEEQDKAADKA